MSSSTDVGVRELKRDLSGYLKRAAAGESIRVTMRGEPIVELRTVDADAPAEPADPSYQAQWDALAASGTVTLGNGRRPFADPPIWTFERSPVDLILEDRAAEDDR